MFSKREGLILYWCEGAKALDVSAVTNSNHEILKKFVYWITKYYKINKSKLKMQLYMWDILNESEAKKFWCSELDLPENNFYKTYFKKKKGNYRKNKYLHGVCRVSFCNTKIARMIKEDINSLIAH